MEQNKKELLHDYNKFVLELKALTIVDHKLYESMKSMMHEMYMELQRLNKVAEKLGDDITHMLTVEDYNEISEENGKDKDA